MKDLYTFTLHEEDPTGICQDLSPDIGSTGMVQGWLLRFIQSFPKHLMVPLLCTGSRVAIENESPAWDPKIRWRPRTTQSPLFYPLLPPEVESQE